MHVDLVRLIDLRLGAVSDEDGLATPLDNYLHIDTMCQKPNEPSNPPRLGILTFFPSGMAERSTSTLAMAKTSADADMFFRNSVVGLVSLALANSPYSLCNKPLQYPDNVPAANWVV